MSIVFCPVYKNKLFSARRLHRHLNGVDTLELVLGYDAQIIQGTEPDIVIESSKAFSPVAIVMDGDKITIKQTSASGFIKIHFPPRGLYEVHYNLFGFARVQATAPVRKTSITMAPDGMAEAEIAIGTFCLAKIAGETALTLNSDRDHPTSCLMMAASGGAHTTQGFIHEARYLTTGSAGIKHMALGTRSIDHYFHRPDQRIDPLWYLYVVDGAKAPDSVKHNLSPKRLDVKAAQMQRLFESVP